MSFKTPTSVKEPPRPNLGESAQLIGLALKHGFSVLRDPTRTDEIFLTAFYTDTLMPGDHLEFFQEPGMTLPCLSRLRSFPEESLGCIYAKYAEPLQAKSDLIDVLVAAIEQDRETVGASLRQRFSDQRRVFRGRILTEQHDLWHIVTGYGTDEVGEVCLQAFNHAQVGNGLSLWITFGGLLRAFVRREWSAFSKVFDAYQCGKNAETLLLVDWQSLWDLPIDQARAKLKLGGMVECA
jgi:ubiquinone biosynthesis protein Coq4